MQFYVVRHPGVVMDETRVLSSLTHPGLSMLDTRVSDKFCLKGSSRLL